MIIEIGEKELVAGLDPDEISEEPRDVLKALFLRRLHIFGIDLLRLDPLVLRGEAQILREIPFLLERISRGDVHIRDGLVARALQIGIAHPRVVKFVIDDLVDHFRKRGVALLTGAVLDEFIARPRHAFPREGLGKIQIGFAVDEFHIPSLLMAFGVSIMGEDGVFYTSGDIRKGGLRAPYSQRSAFFIASKA